MTTLPCPSSVHWVAGTYLALSFISSGSAQVDYDFAVVARTTLAIGDDPDPIIDFGRGPSINDAGKVAFIARDEPGEYGRVIVDNDGRIDRDFPILFTQVIEEDVQINNLDQVTWQDRVVLDGDTFIRRLETDEGGSAIAIGSDFFETPFDYVLQWPTINNSGLVVFGADLQTGGTVLASRASGMGRFEMSPPLSGFPNFFPMVADNGRVVVLGGGSPTAPIIVFTEPTLDRGQAFGVGTFPTFSAMGERPGISDDGRVVVFMAQHGTQGHGVYMSVLFDASITEPFKVADIHPGSDLNYRVGVNRSVSSATDEYTVVYTAGNAASGVRGLYSRPVDITNPVAPVLLPQTKLAEIGDTIGEFIITVVDIDLNDPVNNDGEIAFWIQTTASQAIICAVPIPATGACCLPDASCIETTRKECTTQCGTYQGDDVTCMSVMCAEGDCLAGTFVALAVHGQIPEAFTAPVWEAPAWVAGVPNALQEKIEAVNESRAEMELQQVEFVGLQGNWAQATGDGAKRLLVSRLAYLLADRLELPYREFGFEVARVWESTARRRTSSASRFSADAIAFNVINVLAATRAKHPSDNYPIFLDIYAHSRGTTVASEVLRRMTTTAAAAGPLEVRVFYLDIIDPHPSEPDVDRPFALSGHLLGDPIVERRANEVIYHAHAECAAFCVGFDCDHPLLSEYFWPGAVCRLAELGAEITDEYLRAIGIPRGHGRSKHGYLGSMAEEMCPSSTHGSIPEDFTQRIVDLTVGSPPPVDCPLNIAYSSRLGQLIIDPDGDIPVPVEFVLSVASVADGSGEAIELLGDPTFDEAAAIVDGATQLLSSREFQTILTPEFDPLRVDLETTVTQGFPADSAWQLEGGSVTVDVVDRESRLVMARERATIGQRLDHASVRCDALVARVEFELAEPTSELIIVLEGEGLDASWLVDAGAYEIGVRHVLKLNADRRDADPTTPDSIMLTGVDCLLYAVSVRGESTCLADVDDSGDVGFTDLLAVLAEWGGCANCPADIDGDGGVGFTDLLAVLAAWGPCPT